MKRFFLPKVMACGAALLFTHDVRGASTASSAASGLDPQVLVGVAVILLVAKLGGELFERLHQPAVLGELIAGIIVGNLALVGFTAAEPLTVSRTITSPIQASVSSTFTTCCPG